MAFSGCITDGVDLGAGGADGLTSLSVYEYRHSGDDAAFRGLSYGWMARITNELDAPVVIAVEPLHRNETSWAPATTEEWRTLEAPMVERLEGGESRLYLFSAVFAEQVTETGFKVRVLDLDLSEQETYEIPWAEPGNETDEVGVVEEATFARTLTWPETFTRVGSNQHVRTATVGVWLNGTSFYSNIAELNVDPGFPAGYNTTNVSGDPLPVYVYASQASDQPPRSKDHCYFVTIPGYNDLLKTQADKSTNVRWLAPGEAYTRAGAEGHDLYGDVLVFMNTIVAHDGAVGTDGRVPDPNGDCFHPDNASPVPWPLDWPPVDPPPL